MKALRILSIAITLLALLITCASCAIIEVVETTPKATTPQATTPQGMGSTPSSTPEITTPPGSETEILAGTNDPEMGSVTLTENGSSAELRAAPKSGYRFVAWTKNAPLLSLGEVVGNSPVTTFDEPGVYYANFIKKGGTYLIYHLEGGTTAEGADTYVAAFSHDYFLCPNTVPDTGIFSREGYTLLEYGTKQTGGIAVNPGGKVAPSDTGITELYARWAKWSDPADFTVSGGKITAYRGDDAALVIPAEINGEAVTEIAADAVKGKSFTTLVIPRSVTKIAVGAFVNCPNFDVLYLTDAILEIGESSFTNCRAYRTLCYNAATQPVFGTNFFGGCTIKYEQLLTRDDTPMIVTLGGSSMVYGLDSARLELALDGKYEVVNYGTNQGTCGLLYAAMLANYLHEGDILVHAPEYGGVQFGKLDLGSQGWKTIREVEYCYNLLREVDISMFKNVLTSIAQCNKTYRANLKKTTYDDVTYQMNQKGDGLDNETHKPNLSVGSINIGPSMVSDTLAANFKQIYSLLRESGVTVYFSFAPVLGQAITKESDPVAYAAAIESKLGVRVISVQADYVFTFEQMYDSNYHLTTASAKIRTDRLAADIKQALAAEE